MKILKKKNEMDLIFPIINIILGICIIIFKGETIRWATIVLGSICLVLGVVSLITDMSRHDEGLALSFDIVLIVIGVVAILFGALLVGFVRVVFGIIFIAYGIYKIILSLFNIDLPPLFTVLLISGVLYLTVGIMLFVDSSILYIVLGVLLVLNGILSLFSQTKVFKKKNQDNNNNNNNLQNRDYIDVETRDLN